MMDRLKQLAPREQLVLGIGTLLAIAIIGWSFVWSPLRNGADELDSEVAERSQQVVDLMRAANLDASSTAGSILEGTRSLIVLVDETARPLGLEFTRTNLDGADAIRVSFADARFDRLIEWLISLQQAHGVTVVTASFSRTRSSGLVTGQVQLDRS